MNTDSTLNMLTCISVIPIRIHNINIITPIVILVCINMGRTVPSMSSTCHVAFCTECVKDYCIGAEEREAGRGAPTYWSRI